MRGIVLVLACGAAALELGEPLNWIGGAMLVLVLPGAALVGALPLGASRAERVMLILGLSISISALGGLLLELFGRQSRISWVVWLGVATITGIVVRTVRFDAEAQSNSWSETLGNLRSQLPTLAGCATAVAIAGAGIAIAARSESDNSGPGFTQLSLHPTNQSPHRSWTVAITNHEGSTERYVLRVEATGQAPKTSSTPPIASGLTLRSQVTWRHPAATGSIRVLLTREGVPGVYRRVSAWGP